MDINSKKKFLINVAFAAVWAAIVFFMVKFLFAYLLPIVFAVIIAFFVQKPSKIISEKIRFKFEYTAIIMSLMIYAAIAGVVALFSYMIFRFAGAFFEEMPRYVAEFINFFERFYGSFKKSFSDMPTVIVDFIDSAADSLINLSSELVSVKISSFATAAAQKIPSLLVTGIITVVASCYIAKDYKKLGRFFKSIIPENIFMNILRVKNIFTKSVLKMIFGYLILMLITFGELLIAFLILGIKNSVVTALIISVIDLLPVLGVGIVLIPWSLISIVTGRVYLGVGLLITYFIVMILRNYFEPKIISQQMGISPLLTLIAMFVGLKTAGITGMLLAPLSLIIFIKYYKEEY